ncbi:hypothetical protein D1007_54220 [Hordeum vulgare]|nr:hypothetical protein D1007_54220 [Hordeum vulgare]
MNDRTMVIQEEEVHVDGASALVYDDDIAHVDAYAEAKEIHYNLIGNFDVNLYEQDMDRRFPYRCMYGYDSDDGGLAEELDEDGFTTQENEIFKKVTGKERGAPLFRDLSLAEKAIVDGGMIFGLVEATPCPKVGDPKPKDADDNAHLKNDVNFGCLEDFKICLSDYAIRNHRPFVVGHSNQKVRYTIKCDKEGILVKLQT